MTRKSIPLQMQFSCLLQIEDFPSRYEIYKSLENFLSERNMTNINYESTTNDNMIQLLFNDSSIPLEFSKVLQSKKETLPFYSKIKTKISIDSVQGSLINNSYKTKETTLNQLRKNSQFMNKDQNVNQKYSKGSPWKGEEYHVNSIKSLSKKPLQLLLSNGNAYSAVLPRGRSLRNSVPFLEKEKLEYLEHLKEKEKWLMSKGFDVNIKELHSQRRSEIPNYVHNSPSKYPVHLHQFRDIDKKKWVGKNFNFASDVVHYYQKRY